MQKDNLILEKSYAFSLRIVKLFAHLKKQKVERSLLTQLLRSGTSIGANIEEAVGAQSQSDFIHKLSIAYKEARETSYWLRLLKDAGIIEKKLCESFLNDSEELKKILSAILITSKKHQTN
ncbi:MAG: four helix bundle protein [Ferruginibacter sp.]